MKKLIILLLLVIVTSSMYARTIYLVEAYDLETKSTFFLVKGFESAEKADAAIDKYLKFCIASLESELKTPEDYEKKVLTKMKRDVNLYKLNRMSYTSEIPLVKIIQIEIE